uniref:Uncharacterized protein MANES_01G155900 n=1 Tax=Rhizophora mucronata TaxID=61149 RepID=A0A2P2MCX7_RHIMU
MEGLLMLYLLALFPILSKILQAKGCPREPTRLLLVPQLQIHQMIGLVEVQVAQLQKLLTKGLAPLQLRMDLG